jgi:hypothetical protein
MHGFKYNQLRDRHVNLRQEFLEVFRVVVTKQVLGDAAIAYPLNHGCVVARVGKNLAFCGSTKKIAQCQTYVRMNSAHTL